MILEIDMIAEKVTSYYLYLCKLIMFKSLYAFQIQDNLMHATIRFKYLLQEWSLYIMRNLKIVLATGRFKALFSAITHLQRFEKETVNT